MSRPKPKPTDGWAALLKAEVARRGTAWTPEHKSVKQVRAMLKEAGLPCGECAAYDWLKEELLAGRVEKIVGTSVNAGGRLVRDTRYIYK